MIEDSQPPAYEEEFKAPVFDVMKFQVPESDDLVHNGFTYGDEPVRPTSERFHSSYNIREQEPDMTYVTPAPKSKHNRTKSRDKDVDTTIKKEERKRKRSSPSELDMSLVHAQQERDIMMADAPPELHHSGLTGGLNRLMARNEFPPSPEYSGEYVDSPLSPMKRAKQGASKAFLRAQKQLDLQQEKERKAELKEAKKERGRDRERKERKASTALVKVRPKIKKRDESAQETRKPREVRRRRQYSSSVSPARERKTVKAIEYNPSRSCSPGADGNGQMIVRPTGDMVPANTDHDARAELFMSFINKGPDSERGMSMNKALKRYHRERYDSWDRGAHKSDEEKELWKSMRLRRNDRGEIVLFCAPTEST
jgi:cell growth-regulating nucleolar protein